MLSVDFAGSAGRPVFAAALAGLGVFLRIDNDLLFIFERVSDSRVEHLHFVAAFLAVFEGHCCEQGKCAHASTGILHHCVRRLRVSLNKEQVVRIAATGDADGCEGGVNGIIAHALYVVPLNAIQCDYLFGCVTKRFGHSVGADCAAIPCGRKVLHVAHVAKPDAAVHAGLCRIEANLSAGQWYAINYLNNDLCFSQASAFFAMRGSEITLSGEYYASDSWVRR